MLRFSFTLYLFRTCTITNEGYALLPYISTLSMRYTVNSARYLDEEFGRTDVTIVVIAAGAASMDIAVEVAVSVGSSVAAAITNSSNSTNKIQVQVG